MSEGDRNFRYGYYEKVGFGGIEEILLREKPPDLLAGLSQLTSRSALSPIHRKRVWQLLLDVTHADNRITEARINIQRQTFWDIVEALETMMLTNFPLNSNECPDISIDEHSKLLVMVFLFETKQLKLNIINQFNQYEVINFLCVSKVFTKEFVLTNTPHSLEDAYSILKNFLSLVQTNMSMLIDTYDKFIQTIAKDDHLLHNHLVKNGIIKSFPLNGANTATSNGLYGSASSSSSSSHSSSQITTFSTFPCETWEHQNYTLKSKICTYRPMVTWFVRFFSDIIHHSFLIRIFDKVIGYLLHGSRPFYVLLSVGKALIAHPNSTNVPMKSYILIID
ncbi:hypothetical protein RDWZM_003864 [Blomia tropicalis]|uniref:TBC1 domain family member 7 n=1 Tax=Blomia tropicalis TaxID=40697 RepID=A0A9Q0MGY1_BLOTA|nr:hypothetical protein RDWZM_003864 [Blomia tropicalis]